jgi:glycosyltransferase involved in cell wall biosynthesis
MLRDHGHEVECFLVSTAELDHSGVLRLLRAGFATVWSFRGYYAIKTAISRFSPDIIHVHNTFPLLSPSIFWAAKRASVPVVHTLHNFRLTCANALLLRNEKPCQECVGRFPWPALRYRCYDQSFWRTAAVVSTNVVHRWLGTFTTKVQSYIALTEFSKGIMARSGLPQDRIFVKPNFSALPAKQVPGRLPQAIFVGDISRHKGVHLLLEAWKSSAENGNRLVLIGDGPDRADLERRYSADSSVAWYGFQPHDKVIENLATSRLLVLPSLCYENLPLVALEAFSVGTPVIAPNHGPFPSFMSHQEEGLLFLPGDASSLAATLRAGLDSPDGEWTRWSKNASIKYLREFTASCNYDQLISIYQETIECFRGTRERKKTRTTF